MKARHEPARTDLATISPSGRRILIRLLEGRTIARRDVHPAAIDTLMGRGLVRSHRTPDRPLRLTPTGRNVARQIEALR